MLCFSEGGLCAPRGLEILSHHIPCYSYVQPKTQGDNFPSPCVLLYSTNLSLEYYYLGTLRELIGLTI